MSDIPRIRGTVTLEIDQKGFPEGGLTVDTMMVELADPEIPSEAWLTKLVNLGDVPWLEGETRAVEVIIANDEFRSRVLANSPTLLVRHGPQVIGTLDFCR